MFGGFFIYYSTSIITKELDLEWIQNDWMKWKLKYIAIED